MASTEREMLMFQEKKKKKSIKQARIRNLFQTGSDEKGNRFIYFYHVCPTAVLDPSTTCEEKVLSHSSGNQE